jgi:hypothetical protein
MDENQAVQMDENQAVQMDENTHLENLVYLLDTRRLQSTEVLNHIARKLFPNSRALLQSLFPTPFKSEQE